ncbi:MAG: radical SAM protein [Firmicutes bacterium]|nr:radical SAM protein [Bacillota bacterium]
MYFFPSYVAWREEGGAILVTSRLRANTVKLTDPQVQEEFRAMAACGGCDALRTELAQFLHGQLLLINRQELDAELRELKDVMEQTLLVTIMPTEACNFRCTYCYEDHVPRTLRRRTLDRIQEYIMQQSPKFRTVNISWFGGEPTLCKDVVLETAEMLQKLQQECGFVYTSSMTTNGYLLSLPDFLLYYNAGITSFQITLDGFSHDKTRPHVSGDGTLQTILANLQALSQLPKEEYRFQITLRYNILPDSACDSWYDYLYTLFGQDNRFRVLVRAVGNWGGSSVDSLDLLQGDGIPSALDRHTSYLKKIGLQSAENSDGPLSMICYAGFPHSMVFRADGTIGKCTVALYDPANRIGYVDDTQGVLLDEDANRRWYRAELAPECTACKDMISCLNLQCPNARRLGASGRCDRFTPSQINMEV